MGAESSGTCGPGDRDLLRLFDLVDGLVFSADARTLATTLPSRRSAERLGHPPNVSIDAETFWSFVAAEELRQIVDLLRAVAADGVARSIEHPARVEGHGEAWFRTSVMKADASPGRETRLLGVMLDITTARHIQMQSQEIEGWLVALGDTLPFDFWICAPDGRCVLQNPASRERHGNLLGRASPEWARNIEQALCGEQAREELDREVDGERRYYVRIVSPVRKEHEVHAVLGVQIDVTQLKQTEERLRRSLVELRDAQGALVRKQQLAAMGEMSALVAHEVRNPLGTISNALALLRKRMPRGDHAEELCGIIGEEVDRLDRLVASLLDAVRPMSVELALVPLGDVVEDALAHTLRADGRAENICVHRIVDPALRPIPIDAHLLGLAFRNVFQNALQAMPAGGDLFLEIEHEHEHDGDGEWTRVIIRDSGPGLSQDVRDRIFEPFVTTRPTGSGLGLTIVRRVLEEHGGRVDIYSAPGRGTTCELRIPSPPSTG